MGRRSRPFDRIWRCAGHHDDDRAHGRRDAPQAGFPGPRACCPLPGFLADRAPALPYAREPSSQRLSGFARRHACWPAAGQQGATATYPQLNAWFIVRRTRRFPAAIPDPGPGYSRTKRGEAPGGGEGVDSAPAPTRIRAAKRPSRHALALQRGRDIEAPCPRSPI